MKKLMLYVVIITTFVSFLSCKKDIQIEPIASVKNADVNWNDLIKRFNNETLTKNDWDYLNSKMSANAAIPTFARCPVQAPVLWGHGGTLIFLQSQFEINVHSIYTYLPQPMVQIPALGIFQVTYRSNGLWKIKRVLKVIQPGISVTDFQIMSISNLLIDYGTNFFMESWCISICGNVSHLKETFGPYNNPNTPVMNYQPMQFGKLINE